MRMHAWICRALDLVDRFVPEGIRAKDGDALRNARTIVLLSFMLMLWGPPYMVTTLILGTKTISFLVLTATLGMASVPFLLRRTGNLRLCVHIALFVLWWVLFGSVFALGGATSPSLIWLPCLPLIAMMMLSRSEAIGWALFTSACFASIPVATLLGYEFGLELEGGAFDTYWFLVSVTSVLMFCSVGVGYELAKNRMQADLEEALRATDQALAGTRLVLDNVDQGLLILDAQGAIGSQSSRAVDALVGPPQSGTSFSELLATVDSETGEWWALAWESVTDGFLPLELSINQLPSRVVHLERTLQIRYQPVMDGENLTQVVVVINDISAELAQEQAQLVQQEVLAVFQHLMRDLGGFEAFLREARSLLKRMPQMSPEDTLRAIHTLKGNAGLFSVRSVAEVCHRVEDAMIQGSSEEAGVDAVLQAWCAFEERLSELRGEETQDALPVTRSDLARLRAAIETGQSPISLLSLMEGWDKESLGARLARFGEQSQTLADRLGKWGLRVAVSCPDLRADAGVLEPLWSAFAHAVRNAVDHGIESPKARLEENKPAQGSLCFSGEVRDEVLVIELQDDGAGVDWSQVRAKAGALGLPYETQADLEEALFRDGLSCKQEVSELSGRGVGLSALRAVVEGLEGSVRIASVDGQGTTLRLQLPLSLVWQAEVQGIQAA